ncbi:MAG: ABC transporter substrate-binding protein, partial [Acidimicrobiia bacterium]
MVQQRKTITSLVVMITMLVAACGGTADPGTETTAGSSTAETTAGTTATTEPTTATTAGQPAPSGDAVEIRWFVGLGAGGQPEQIEAQEAVVEEFNASHDDIQIVLEIVENDVAYDTLSTQVAGGNPPDIIGPVGRDGSNSYAGLYLDLEPLIASTGFDTSRWPQETIDNFREDDGTLPGLPFASFPSFIYYN